MSTLTRKVIEIFNDLNKNRNHSILIRAPILFISNWTFQGFFGMDLSERIFKISLDLIGTLIFALILCQTYFSLDMIIISYLIAHTLNFIFNGQILSLIKKFGWTKTSEDCFQKYMSKMLDSVKKEASILEVAIIGSFSRDEESERSDIDVRLMRMPGKLNGIKSCIFALRQRCTALFSGIPLDILVSDNYESFRRTRSDEKPLIVYRKGSQL